mgnify:CR=1 FL=1
MLQWHKPSMGSLGLDLEVSGPFQAMNLSRVSKLEQNPERSVSSLLKVYSTRLLAGNCERTRPRAVYIGICPSTKTYGPPLAHLRLPLGSPMAFPWLTLGFSFGFALGFSFGLTFGSPSAFL